MNNSPKNKIYIIPVVLAALFILFTATKTEASQIQRNVLTTLSCTGAVSNQCNTSCNASDTLTEDRSFYFDGGWMGGNSVWNDDLGYSATLSGSWGSVDVINTSTGATGMSVSSCGTGHNGGSGLIPQTNMYTGWQDNDTMTIKILTLRKATDSAYPPQGSIPYILYTVNCAAWQYTLQSVCTDIGGTIGVDPQGSGQSGSPTMTCAIGADGSPCNIEIHWTVSGVNGKVTRGDSTTLTTGSGTITADSLTTPGTYQYYAWAQSGDMAWHTVAQASVTVNGAPTATLWLSASEAKLTPSHPGDSSVQISNINATNGGTFTVGQSGCNIVSSNSTFPGGSISYTCPSSTGPISISTLNLSPTAGPYSATLQVTAAGQNGTVVSNASQSVAISYTPQDTQPAAPTCTVSASTNTVGPNQSVTFTANSSPSGQAIDWYGTNNGTAIGPVPGATVTQDTETYQYSQLTAGTYTRYFKVRSGTQCANGQSNTVTVTVNQASTPTPTGGLSCSASPTQQINYGPYKFTLSVGNAKPGYNYNWSQPCNIISHTDGYQSIQIDCGYTGGLHSASVTEAATSQGANCPNFCGAVDSGDCVPPNNNPPPSFLSAAKGVIAPVVHESCDDNGNCSSYTTQDYTVVEPYAQTITWPAPLNTVSLKFSFPFSSTFSGANAVQFDCNNDGNYDVTLGISPYAGDISTAGICNYSTPGTYTAHARAVYSWYGGVSMTGPYGNGLWCYNRPCDGTATIVVGPSIPPTVTLDNNQTSYGLYPSYSLYWTVSHATSCSGTSSPANDMWDGSKSTLGGSQNINSYYIPYTTTFNITCVGPSGSATANTTIRTRNDPFAEPMSVTLPNYCANPGASPVATVAWQYYSSCGDPSECYSPYQNYTYSGYQVQIADNSNFNNPAVDTGQVIATNPNTYTTPAGLLQNSKTYYAHVRVYSIYLSGGVSSWSTPVTFTTPKHNYPSVNFSVAPASPTVNSSVQFTDSSTISGGNGGTTYAWSFGDSGSSSSQNPSHSYTNANSYTVVENVTDKDGYMCSATKPVTVAAPNPVNGVCGSANKTYPAGSTSYGSDTYCAAGTPSSSPAFPPAGGSSSWTCNGSNGGSNSGQCTASVPLNQYSVTVTKTAGGSVKAADNSISCGSVCSKTYTNGTNVTLTATPDSSYWQFSGWSGDCTGTGQCVLNVTSAKNVNATFAPRNLQYQEF